MKVELQDLKASQNNNQEYKENIIPAKRHKTQQDI
jgi:hypothetical protein